MASTFNVRLQALSIRRIVLSVSILGVGIGVLWPFSPASLAQNEIPRNKGGQKIGVASQEAHYRSPIDIVLLEDQGLLVSVNQTSSTLSLLRARDGQLLDEVQCGEHPYEAIACLDGRGILVSGAYAGTVELFAVVDEKLVTKGQVVTGYEPRGLAAHKSLPEAYVGLHATGEVCRLDLVSMSIVDRWETGKWPNHLALTDDGKRLAVGCSGESMIRVLETETGEELYRERLSSGINLGQMVISPEDGQVYFPWMVYRNNPITVGNIRQGWVLASRIGRVRMDGPSYREAISLDVPGKAVADPYGIVISPNHRRLVTSSSGTHEVLIYRLRDLPFEGSGGPGDLINRSLLGDEDRFRRLEVGGRPMGMAIATDNETVYVANFLRDSIQVVNIEQGKLVREYPLGEPTEVSLTRRGMEVFYDARRSLDQWYSCHSCHQDGGGNSKTMDTFNDGTELTNKTVLPLHGVHETSPWTWHGWQQDLRDSIRRSFTSTMQGNRAPEEDVEAVLSFMSSLEIPPNPFLTDEGERTPAAKRGEKIFHGKKAGCAECHYGDRWTDGEVHELGLGRENDPYQGFNTPSLVGVYRKVRWMHDGRAKSLENLLTGPHSPDKVAGNDRLNEQELEDLIAFLKSL